MDLLANDLTAILALLAAILSVIAGALPLFKKTESISLLTFFKKSGDMANRHLLKKSEVTTLVVIARIKKQ